ncbi:MAG TPA: glycosyltransferase family A protein [Candidatus Obscuribacterales bacterium]
MTGAGPLVSVIIPFFQQDDYLLEAVESSANQTYENLEIVVVDDCSPGRSAGEILSVCRVPRLKVLRHEENLGPSAARNTAVAHSSGEFILPLDADDKISLEYLATTVAAFQDDPELGAVYTSAQLFGDEDNIWHPQTSVSYLLCNGSPNTFLYRRELFDALGGYKPYLRLGENTDFWLRAQLSGWRFLHIDRPLYFYRKHRGGITSTESCFGDRARILVREHRELVANRLEEILLEQTQRYCEQIAAYDALREQYMQLHAEVTERWDQLNHYYEHHLQATPARKGGLLGALTSLFKMRQATNK